jgi:UDP-2-acetamido-2,6-beta-L-arabino-hexul-4-ose reductase
MATQSEIILYRVVVTGAGGFIGKNLCSVLRHRKDVVLIELHKEDTWDTIKAALSQADVIIHLAGVNRPKDEIEFEDVNVSYTAIMCQYLIQTKHFPKIVFASSTQAGTDTPYGKSKLEAERVIANYVRNGGRAAVYRLCGVFGKWCRPNYNSVVATWCDAIAYNLPVRVDDPNKSITLCHVDDVVDAFIEQIDGGNAQFPAVYETIPASYLIKLSILLEKLRLFHTLQGSSTVPTFHSKLDRDLYATYLTYIHYSDLEYNVDEKCDVRGTFAELLKLGPAGQISVSTTNPGVTRGNHYHQSKVEKFIVLHGRALIRLRKIDETNTREYEVSDHVFTVVDIPPGYTHSLTNTGSDVLVTLFWASEVYDNQKPDTYYEEVLDTNKLL